MVLHSVLDLKALLWGVQLQQAMWVILIGTGLVWLPILLMTVQTALKAPADNAIPSLTVRLSLFFIAMSLAGTPAVSLDASTLIYEADRCENLSLSPDADALAELTADGGEVSLLVAAVVSLGSGLNNAVIAAIGCRPDTRHALALVSEETVADPFLADEVEQFVRDCHVIAKSRFYGEAALNNGVLAQGEGYPEDFLWSFYLETPGYYPDLRAQEQVAAMPFDDRRDGDETELWAYQGGLPHCDEWLFSLRERLLAEADPQALAEVQAFAELADDYTREEAENAFIQGSVLNTLRGASGSEEAAALADIKSQVAYNGYGLNFFSDGGIAGWLWNNVGSWLARVVVEPWLAALKEGLGLARAALLWLLLLVYVPLVVFSGFRPSVLVTWSVVVGITLMWGALWTAISVLENMLAGVFFPKPETALGTAKAMVLGPWESFQRLVFDVVFGLMYMLAPLWLYKVAGWAGTHTAATGDIVGALTGQAGDAMKDGARTGTGLGAKKLWR